MSELLDGFYRSAECPDEYIKDISKKMQVPHRISFGSTETLSNKPVMAASNDINMAVPEKIVVSSGVTDKKTKQDTYTTYDVSLDDLDINPMIVTRPSLPPPPSTLVLNEIEYPDLDRLYSERQDLVPDSSIQNQTTVNPTDRNKIPKLPVVALAQTCELEQQNNSASLVSNHSGDEKRLRVLEKRVAKLEREFSRRSQLDQVCLVVLGVYLALKAIRSLFRVY
ncbi:unnamed protein product [Calicophoron daubneyi]|uniref:Mitochondrial fission factor n=1 Tax=Calicophoron daubneyi TaxID=300641 RepID=A0AAV2TGA5_CALDB